MAAWIKMPLDVEVSLGPGDFVLDGDPAPPPRKGAEPQILNPGLLWPNGWMDQDGTCHRGRPQPRRLCVRWGPAPSPKNWRSPSPYSAYFYCGQTAGCIKMSLGMGVGVSPGDFVLDGVPAPLSEKGAEPPLNFRTMFIVAKRLDGSR